MNTKHLKPFDLEAALKGEPVMLRDGTKAFIRHHETEFPVGDDFRLFGILCVGLNTYTTTSWTTQGKWRYESEGHEFDIVGMWPKTRIINGFEVPAPEHDAPNVEDEFYIPFLSMEDYCDEFTWVGDKWDSRILKRGLVFLNEEDAIANAKAMLGINPYEESE